MLYFSTCVKAGPIMDMLLLYLWQGKAASASNYDVLWGKNNLKNHSRNGAKWIKACFTNDNLNVIQIWWEMCIAVIRLPAITLVPRAALYHEKHFLTIIVLKSRWEENEISIDFQLRRNTRKWNGPQFL